MPRDLVSGDEKVEEYLNQLNCELLGRLQKSGEAFLTNAVIDGTFLLRACIVNFRTSACRGIPGASARYHYSPWEPTWMPLYGLRICKRGKRVEGNVS